MNKNTIHGTVALLFVMVVCILSAAAVDDTVTRDLPTSANAGASITVTLTVGITTGATYHGVDEIVPSGWTVTSATGGGDYTSETGHVRWVVTTGAADKVYSYTVTVPVDTSGVYTFGGTYSSEVTAETAILGETTMKVSVEDTTTTIGTTTSTTTTPAPPGEHMTPTPAATKTPTAKPASAPATGGGGTTPDAPAKNGLPGFEGATTIAGLLAIGYVMMRRKR